MLSISYSAVTPQNSASSCWMCSASFVARLRAQYSASQVDRHTCDTYDVFHVIGLPAVLQTKPYRGLPCFWNSPSHDVRGCSVRRADVKPLSSFACRYFTTCFAARIISLVGLVTYLAMRETASAMSGRVFVDT